MMTVVEDREGQQVRLQTSGPAVRTRLAESRLNVKEKKNDRTTPRAIVHA
jgi:hypothetical protein